MLSRWRVFAGAVAQASPQGLQLGVQAVIYHGGYLPFRDPNSEENSNDIALVHLSRTLPLTGSFETGWPWCRRTNCTLGGVHPGGVQGLGDERS